MDHKFISSKNFFSGVRKAVSLYKNIWREGTTALIHGPREADKSARALDIALDVAHTGRRVLYVNAEDRLDRVAADDAGHDNLYVFTPEFSALDDSTDYADLVFEAIGQAVRTTDIRTFVIDSVSRIAALSFGRNASPAYIMKRLVALQVKCRLSVLVVADDAQRPSTMPSSPLPQSISQTKALTTLISPDGQARQTSRTRHIGLTTRSRQGRLRAELSGAGPKKPCVNTVKL